MGKKIRYTERAGPAGLLRSTRKGVGGGVTGRKFDYFDMPKTHDG